MQKKFLVLSIAVFLDQISKWWFMNLLSEPPHFIRVMPLFNLTAAWNKGVSFSMFTSDNVYAPYILTLVAIAIVAFILRWHLTEANKYNKIALELIAGGAIGNIIDRIRFGAVFDFLDFYIGKHHWPAFNVADSAITIGAAILIMVTFFEKKVIKG
ncbi:MAG: signal peptidase II [Alphaproteobacteria bacterium]